MKRLGVIGIVIEEKEKIPEVNRIIGEFSEDIMGRMGIPEKERSVISLIVFMTVESVGALTGKIGRLSGVNVKSVFTK